MAQVKGDCYPAAEAVYHKMGGKAAGLTPMRIVGTKVFYIDPTAQQFSSPVPYPEGKGCGFLTKEPSKRAKELM